MKTTILRLQSRRFGTSVMTIMTTIENKGTPHTQNIRVALELVLTSQKLKRFERGQKKFCLLVQPHEYHVHDDGQEVQ